MFRSGAGERIGGYRVVRRLATGGTSDVLLAKAEGPHGFERTVVLKLLLAQYQDDQEAMAMFAREASAYARLSHASIVQLYDFFAQSGQLVMVLEYVDGPALHRLRGMLRTVGQHVEDRGALYLATRIFAALAAAHSAKDESNALAPVIHRDVNPSNILLPWDGQVKIADFGVAKVSGTGHQSSVGVLKGTYGYMAPEQVTGEPVTPATDVYAGAIVLWELLTRRRAFQRGALPEVEALRQMSEPRIPSLDTVRPELPKGLRDLVRRALTPDVRQRDVTAEEAVAVLRSLVSTDEGRESLASSLAAVRHEPRPQMTSAPPPEDETQRVPFAAPRTAQAPSPAAGAPPSAPKPPPPVPRASPPSSVSTRTPPPPRPTPKKPSVPAPGEVVPRAKSELGTGTASGLGPLAIPTPSDPGILKSAIDEVLRDVPSAIPPDVFSGPGEARAPETGARDAGGLPPAPLPLVSSRSPSQPLSFPSLERTLAMDDRPVAAAPLPVRPRTAADDVGELPFPVRAAVPGAGPGPFGGLLGLVGSGGAAPPTEASPRMPSEPPVATMPMPPVGANAAPSSHTLAMNAPVMTAKSADLAPAEGPRPSKASTLLSAQSVPPGPVAPLGAPPGGAAAIASGGSSGSAALPPQLMPATTSSAPVATAGASLAPADRSSVAAPRPPRRRWPLALVGLLVLGASGGVTWKERGRLAAQLSAVRGATATPPALPSPAASSTPTPPTEPAVAAPTSTPTPTEPAAPGPAPTETAAAAPAPTETPTPTPTPTETASPVPTDSAAPPKPAPARGVTTGLVKTTGATPHRRIFVDDITVGQTPDSVTVRCGMRSIRIGSSGKPQRLEVPCGGELTLSDR